MDINCKPPLVSVVIPSYNHAVYVSECIKSIIDQNYKRIELIIIDDGSSDSSVAVIKNQIPACIARFERFEFIHRDNKGLAITLNEGLAWCRGEYYSPIASDDFMLPTKIIAQVEYFIENPESVAVFGGAYIVDEESRLIHRRPTINAKYSFEDLFILKRSVIAPTAMLRTDAVRLIGPIPSNLGIEDLYMWLKLTENGARIDVIDRFLVAYRKHPENFSGKLAIMANERAKLLSYFEKKALYKSAKAHWLLLASSEYWYVDKYTSVQFLFRALTESYSIMKSKRFIMHLIRIIFPKAFLSHIKRAL